MPMQHVAPKNVATCCISMLRSFGWGFKISNQAVTKSPYLTVVWIYPIFFASVRTSYLATLPVCPRVSKFFIKSPGLSECLLGDFQGLFLDILFNDILTNAKISRHLQIFVLWGLAGMEPITLTGDVLKTK